jgi:zinc transport system substrate-binding protein
MIRTLALFLTLIFLVGAPARADRLRVAVDLPAVQSLVAQVAGDLAETGFVMQPGASPHGYAMRPSEARVLQSADVVIWIGPEQSPWLDRAIASLAPTARALALIDSPGTLVLPRRDRPVFAAVGDEHEGGDHDHEDAHDDHDHGMTDPHAWLDPVNAQTWLGHIADTLSLADPDHAAAYAANAAAASAHLDATRAAVAALLAPVRGRAFVVYHDAYQYFETRFEIPSAAAISASDAAAPGPARLSALRAALRDQAVTCVFAEPQFDPRLITALIGDTGVRTATLDPVGRDIAPGPGFYDALLTGLAENMAACLR